MTFVDIQLVGDEAAGLEDDDEAGDEAEEGERRQHSPFRASLDHIYVSIFVNWAFQLIN